MGLYDQYRSESTAPYAAAAAGQQDKRYQRGDLIPIPELRASPFRGNNPALLAGAETPFPSDLAGVAAFNQANSPAATSAPPAVAPEAPEAVKPKHKVSPSEILAASILGMLAGASKYPVQQMIMGHRPVFNAKDQLAFGAAGALVGGAGAAIKPKIMNYLESEDQ